MTQLTVATCSSFLVSLTVSCVTVVIFLFCRILWFAFGTCAYSM